MLLDTAEQIKAVRLKEPYYLMRQLDQLNTKLNLVQRTVPSISRSVTQNKINTIQMIQQVLNVQ